MLIIADVTTERRGANAGIHQPDKNAKYDIIRIPIPAIKMPTTAHRLRRYIEPKVALHPDQKIIHNEFKG